MNRELYLNAFLQQELMLINILKWIKLVKWHIINHIRQEIVH